VAKEAAADGSRHVSWLFLSSASDAAKGSIATFFPSRSHLRSSPGRAPEPVRRLDRRDRIRFNTKALAGVQVTLLRIGFSRHQGPEHSPGAGWVAKEKMQAGREILIVGDVFGSGTTDSDCARPRWRAGASKGWTGQERGRAGTVQARGG
jgi:hypothetical protein